jgi:Uma2 family endonuclease
MDGNSTVAVYIRRQWLREYEFARHRLKSGSFRDGYVRALTRLCVTAYNARMSTRASDYLDAISHMPGGSTLVFYDVTWGDYEQLLHDLPDSHFRVSYDDGRLQVVSPSAQHEEYARVIGELVRLFSYEFGLTVQNYGSTTWRQKRLKQGVEADVCFYIANAERVIGKREIDLDSDPPPDVIVEVDITKESVQKFRVYASLRIPELWRYDGNNVEFYELSGDHYREVLGSRFIPALTPAKVKDALKDAVAHGQTEALLRFRDRLRQLPFER